MPDNTSVYDVLAHNEIYGFDDEEVNAMGRISDKCGWNSVGSIAVERFTVSSSWRKCSRV